MSGIKTLWIGAYESDVVVAPKYPKRIYDILDGTGQPLKFYKFPLPIDLGDASEEMSADPKLGTSFVELSINGTLLGVEHDTSVELSNIAKGKQIIVAELYNYESNGKPKYIVYGEENGVDMTSGGSRTGAEGASLQGYEVTWTGKELNYARHAELDDILIDESGEFLTFNLSGPSNVQASYDEVAGELSVAFDDVASADGYEVRYSVDGGAYQYEAGTSSPIVISIAQTSEEQVVKYGVRYTISTTNPPTESGYTPGEDIIIPST
jgi:hypothetical protein